MTEFKLFNEDILTFKDYAEVPKCEVAAFSPPYKRKDGFSWELMGSVGKLVEQALQPGGWVFFNFAQLSEDFQRPQKAFGAFLTASGLRAHQTIIWVKSYSPAPGEPCKGHCQPLNSPNLLNYSWEYIFTAFKPNLDGSAPEFDRLSIGVPFADKGNLSRGDRGKHGDLRCAGDVWVIPYQTTGKNTKKTHEYEWPEALVERMLKCSGVPSGSYVLDPFMGGGQTAVVAKKLGLSAVGFEKDKAKAEGALGRWAQV